MAEVGKLLIILGAVVLLMGVLFVVIGRVPPLGHLPGDIAFRLGNVSFYFPIVTCLAASILLTLLLNIAARLFR